jgi:acylphosphatase
MTSLSKKLIISGKVQGVGYRFWLKNLCEKNCISGWVCNNNNGEVEATFSNINEEMFKIILTNCFVGPAKAQVKNIQITTLHESKNLNSFEIKK